MAYMMANEGRVNGWGGWCHTDGRCTSDGTVTFLPCFSCQHSPITDGMDCNTNRYSCVTDSCYGRFTSLISPIPTIKLPVDRINPTILTHNFYPDIFNVLPGTVFVSDSQSGCRVEDSHNLKSDNPSGCYSNYIVIHKRESGYFDYDNA